MVINGKQRLMVFSTDGECYIDRNCRSYSEALVNDDCCQLSYMIIIIHSTV